MFGIIQKERLLRIAIVSNDRLLGHAMLCVLCCVTLGMYNRQLDAGVVGFLVVAL